MVRDQKKRRKEDWERKRTRRSLSRERKRVRNISTGNLDSIHSMEKVDGKHSGQKHESKDPTHSGGEKTKERLKKGQTHHSSSKPSDKKNKNCNRWEERSENVSNHLQDYLDDSILDFINSRVEHAALNFKELTTDTISKGIHKKKILEKTPSKSTDKRSTDSVVVSVRAGRLEASSVRKTDVKHYIFSRKSDKKIVSEIANENLSSREFFPFNSLTSGSSIDESGANIEDCIGRLNNRNSIEKEMRKPPESKREKVEKKRDTRWKRVLSRSSSPVGKINKKRQHPEDENNRSHTSIKNRVTVIPSSLSLKDQQINDKMSMLLNRRLLNIKRRSTESAK